MDARTLKEILVEEMSQYAGEGLNAYSYLTQNDAESLYTVIDIAQVRGKRIVGTVLVARISGEQIIIELDHNNKQLVDALIARNIPENQIVLAYRDDVIPM